MQNHALVTAAKEAALSKEARPTRIVAGVYRGIVRRMAPYNTVQVKYGLWERETYPYIRKALSASWMIDIGAGWGEMVALFALRSQASPIWAVEPMPEFREHIRDTLALNGCSATVELLTDYIGTQALRLDSFPTPPNGRGFIKIDVDGAEIDVLRSGQKLLRERRPMILLETHSVDLERQSIAFLKALGYSTKIIKNAWWRRIVPERRAWSDHNRWLFAD